MLFSFENFRKMVSRLRYIIYQVTISSVEKLIFYSLLFRRISREIAYFRRNYHHSGTAVRGTGQIKGGILG